MGSLQTTTVHCVISNLMMDINPIIVEETDMHRSRWDVCAVSRLFLWKH